MNYSKPDVPNLKPTRGIDGSTDGYSVSKVHTTLNQMCLTWNPLGLMAALMVMVCVMM